MNDNLNVDFQKIRETAEQYYRSGQYYCSEAIIKTIRDEFNADFPESIISLASGFPVGMGGAGCTCGAVAGGIMAIGMFFGRIDPGDKKIEKTMSLSKELHDIFKKRHGHLCCRVLTNKMTLGSPEHMKQCISFTGEVCEQTSRIIARELENSNC